MTLLEALRTVPWAVRLGHRPDLRLGEDRVLRALERVQLRPGSRLHQVAVYGSAHGTAVRDPRPALGGADERLRPLEVDGPGPRQHLVGPREPDLPGARADGRGRLDRGGTRRTGAEAVGACTGSRRPAPTSSATLARRAEPGPGGRSEALLHAVLLGELDGRAAASAFAAEAERHRRRAELHEALRNEATRRGSPLAPLRLAFDCGARIEHGARGVGRGCGSRTSADAAPGAVARRSPRYRKPSMPIRSRARLR